jgi:hypothetical protein
MLVIRKGKLIPTTVVDFLHSKDILCKTALNTKHALDVVVKFVNIIRVHGLCHR